MKKIITIFLNICLVLTLSIPIYANTQAYEAVNDNVPVFSKEELVTRLQKKFSPLDDEGRCQTAFAVIGQDLMPTKKRESIGMIKPSGWHLVRDDDIDGRYLYNRCHLIGFQLCGENANELNLITGTRFLNVQGMLPFENMVADYVKETDHHVAYRVTPIFENDNQLASGVQIEAESVEDSGESIEFNVYCYNIQPGYQIDYATGDSQKTATDEVKTNSENQNQQEDYIINVNTKVFHRPDCSSVKQMAEHNKEYYTGSRKEIIKEGYRPCKNCDP